MRARFFAATIVGIVAFAFPMSSYSQQYAHVAPSDSKTPEEELKTFKLPPGFEAQLVAAEPDIRKPIQMAFDAKGRLWVSTSEEYPFAAIGRPGKDRLYVLDDFGADGKAKKVSIFADDLNIPIGVLPLPDCKSAIASSIEPAPNKETRPTCWIWKLTDTDGDGKCDQKEKLYGPFGCDDTHGMNNSYTLMPDGWVYACHGFKNDSKPKGKDGHTIEMNSGHTFRFRPDGSRIEIWTRGQVNPFGIAVDPYFNLYTADCHSKPITQLIRGATYQSFAKGHDGLGFAPHVTDHTHNSTALCGLVYYAADHFPAEYRDCMLLGNVTSNCINFDKIEFTGSTPKATEKPDFSTSTDPWFRPVDIKLGPDGALYFTDFYNRIIGHYEVSLDHKGRDKLRGRVWRVIYRGPDGKGEAPKMPRDLTKASPKELFEELGNSNLAVRLQVLQQMIRGGEQTLNEIGPLPKDGADQERLAYYLWALGRAGKRADSLPSEKLFESLDDNPHPLLTAHVMKTHDSLELGQDFDANLSRFGVGFKNAQARRAAVESMIIRSTADNVRPLLTALAKCPVADNHLKYALRVALRESVLSLFDWDKAADQTPWTEAEIKLLADIAPSVHTPAAAEFLANHLGVLASDARRLSAYVEHAIRNSPDEDLNKQVLKYIENGKVHLLLAYQQGVLKRGDRVDKQFLAVAENALEASLYSNNPEALSMGVELAGALKVTRFIDRITSISEAKENSEALRIAALSSLAAIDAVHSSPVFIKLLSNANQAIAIREKAAQLLAATNRVDAQEELVKAFLTAPARLQNAMAVAMAATPTGAKALLKAVEEGKASARLLQERIVVARLHERNFPDTAQRLATLTKGLPSADDKMLKLLAARRDGFGKTTPDSALGKLVFTKNCANCHQIGNEGTKIGPQLDGIGGRGLERLLEDVLDSSRNVDAAFRTTILELTNGTTVRGLQLREEGELVVMADDKGKEVKIAKKDIVEKRTSPLSPMPANLVEVIPEKDFHDLIAYLLLQQPKEK